MFKRIMLVSWYVVQLRSSTQLNNSCLQSKPIGGQRDLPHPLRSAADDLPALLEGRCVQHEEHRHEECRD